MTREKQAIEDVFPVKNCDFPAIAMLVYWVKSMIPCFTSSSFVSLSGSFRNLDDFGTPTECGRDTYSTPQFRMLANVWGFFVCIFVSLLKRGEQQPKNKRETWDRENFRSICSFLLFNSNFETDFLH